MTGAIVLTGTIRCAVGEVERLCAAVPVHVELTRAEPGCQSFEIGATVDSCAFAVIERFRDEAAFAAHQARTRGSAWWQITSHMHRDFEVTRE